MEKVLLNEKRYVIECSLDKPNKIIGKEVYIKRIDKNQKILQVTTNVEEAMECTIEQLDSFKDFFNILKESLKRTILLYPGGNFAMVQVDDDPEKRYIINQLKICEIEKVIKFIDTTKTDLVDLAQTNYIYLRMGSIPYFCCGNIGVKMVNKNGVINYLSTIYFCVLMNSILGGDNSGTDPSLQWMINEAAQKIQGDLDEDNLKEFYDKNKELFIPLFVTDPRYATRYNQNVVDYDTLLKYACSIKPQDIVDVSIVELP